MLALIIIDVSELESERSDLSIFLESKIGAPIKMEGKILVVDSTGKMLLPRNVKTYVKHFLYHRGFSETYRVTEEHELIRITSYKYRGSKKVKRERTAPSPYDTLPYYFPMRP